MFCHNCGKKVDSYSKYCPYCGEKLQKIQSKNLNKINRENKKFYLFLILSFIVVNILVFLLFYFHNKKDDKIEYIESKSENKEVTLPINPGIHKYEIINSPESFNDAIVKAKEKGGYLLHIDTDEEFSLINNLLEEKYQNGDPTIQYYIGGKRFADAGYKWIDENGNTYGDIINNIHFWYPGEPSFQDENDIDQRENVLSIMRDSGNWLVNDVMENIDSVYDDFKGKTGYIIEYE